ncbi:MAG TPA: fibronectin type III domain-containing protein, partial [Segetibacter sp.]
MLNTLFCTIVATLMLGVTTTVKAQSGIFDSNDPDVIFTSSNQPSVPSYGKIAKWGHSAQLTWNSLTPYDYGYKSYYYKGLAFRLKFPKSYQQNVNDGKKYPVFIFFHGLGEKGSVWDNEYQLRYGGQIHADSVNGGSFDGFLLYPQNQNGFFDAYFTKVTELVDSMSKYVKADVDKVIISGVSAGGQGSWGFLGASPATFAAAIPISAARPEFYANFPKHITIPISTANGGRDNNPDPSVVTESVERYRALGGDITQTYYPEYGHTVWDRFWEEKAYFQKLNTYHKANPLVYFGRTEFCIDDAVSVRMGLHPGFYAYEWQKDNVTIPGATSSEYATSQLGTYRARFKRTANSAWSEWSPKPVVIKIKGTTISPPIQINGLKSNILPSPDGSSTVPLIVPNTYATYEWRNVVDNSFVGNSYIYNAPPGIYKVRVTEKYGCSSTFSEPFTVTSSNGNAKPDKPTNFIAVAVSNSAIRLDWSDNPNPTNNETGFEIYRATGAGGPYSLITITGSDVLTYTNTGLQANTFYYYIIRAINNDGASVITPEISIKTTVDLQPPTAPADLRIAGSTRSTVDLTWLPSSDDVGVTKYDIYINGVKSYTTTETYFTVLNLTKGVTYAFSVKARDFAGNISAASNQVTASAILSGLYYKYYHGIWNLLPNFKSLTPVYIGNSPNIDITQRSQNDNFAFLWEGSINIPVSGTYYFRTNSDDGSRVWLGQLNGSASPYDYNGNDIVNNDGSHGAVDKTSVALNLTAGTYPIAIAYFDKTGAEQMVLSWSTPSTGGAFELVPNSAFQDVYTSTNAPAVPSNLKATAQSIDKIRLTWTDNSTNESGFELWRSRYPNTGFITVGTVSKDITTFLDSALSPNTSYYYKIRAVGLTGESKFYPQTNVEALWRFDNNYNDSSGNNKTLTPNYSPTFNTDSKEGTYSVDLNGTNSSLTINTVASDYLTGNYSSKTIACWVRSRVTNSNKGIFDIGGADNGLAMRINANQLIAGIASNNTRRSLATSFSSTDWNHIALVYSGNTLRLYVNAVEVASNTSLPFTSVGTTTDSSMIGDDYGNTGNDALNTYFGAWNGRIDDFWVVGSALSQTDIAGIMNRSFVFQSTDKTFPLPPVPAKPSNLNLSAATTSSINLSWTDNSSDETGFEIWRSVNKNDNYRVVATVDANTTNYNDQNLFSNVIYYYKIAVKGVGGRGEFSNEEFTITKNNFPKITPISSFTIRHSVQSVLKITATDEDLEKLTLTVSNLPSFATFTNSGDGAGQISFNPASTNQGVYEKIRVIVTDTHNGADTVSFDVNVNDNYVPVITPIGDKVVNENSKTTIDLTANDQDGNLSLQWQTTGLPSFITLTPNENGAAKLFIAPGYAHAGLYSIDISVTDNAGAIGTYKFNLTVNNVEPSNNKWYVNLLKNGMPGGQSPWNNITSLSASNLKDQNNNTTSAGFQFLTNALNIYNGGAVTGNNSGAFPDNVLRDYYYFGIFGAPETVSFKMTGLDTTYRYNVTLMAGSSWTGVADNGSTVFTIGDVSKSLYVQNNATTTVTFTSVDANANGELVVGMSKGVNTPAGYLNAFVVEKLFDDKTTPIMPINLTAQNIENGGVKLVWSDIAYNEFRYNVYRSTSPTGTFTLLNPGDNNSNATEYVDTTVSGVTTYYYKVVAANNYGYSAFTDVVSIKTPNKAPILGTIANAYTKVGNTTTIDVNATDGPGENLTIIIRNLPTFGTFATTSNGRGIITLKPGKNDFGTFKDVTAVVTDVYGASTQRKFDIYVSDSLSRSVFINMAGEFGKPESTPWNNFTSYPFAGLGMDQLKDDQGNVTNFSLRLIDKWTQSWNGGMITGDNSGIYSDNVIQTSIYEGSTDTKRMRFTGLDINKRYNISVFSSNNAGFDASFSLISGTQAKFFDAKFNSARVVQLNGLVPNVNGEIEFSMTKSAEATYMFLNAVVLQEYSNITTLLRPSDLVTQINAVGRVNLYWSDKSIAGTTKEFEVWRAPSGSHYSLLSKVTAGSPSFADSTLAPNRRYYYKVRSIGIDGTVSEYSNSASAILGGNTVLLNLNLATPQAAPWNNTNNTPMAGTTVRDLKNTNGVNTGFSMVLTNDWGGYFDQGMTGGVLPDNVMLTSWWIDGNGTPAKLKLYNLEQSKRYRIGFMGSSSWQGDFTASYSIGNRIVYLNSYKNNSKIVYIDDVVTNADGEVDVTMGYISTTRWSFLSAIIIEAYDEDNTPPIDFSTPPIANAGLDQFIHLPTNTAQLNGSGSTDADGSIVSYEWTKLSGPLSYTINNSSSATPLISNLVNGVYSMELRVIDNDGQSAKDTLMVTVNRLPVANAGSDVYLTLPINSTTLNGSASSD